MWRRVRYYLEVAPAQFNALHWVQRSNLKSAWAWRLKQALQRVFREARDSNCEEIGLGALTKWGELGAALAAGTIQAPGDDVERTPRWGGARHA